MDYSTGTEVQIPRNHKALTVCGGGSGDSAESGDKHPAAFFILITLNYQCVMHRGHCRDQPPSQSFLLSLLSVLIETDSYTTDCVIRISLAWMPSGSSLYTLVRRSTS